MSKITKRVIDSLEPDADGKEAWVWDGELKGFGVRVQSSGVMSFVVKYRNAEGRQRKLAIGRVGTLTPDEARAVARQKLAAAHNGEDPSAARRELRRSMTVDELCDLYIEDATLRIKASTLAMDRSRIDRHVRPLLGKRTIRGLTLTDIERMQADITAGKTAFERKGRGGQTRGGKGVAGRTVGMVRTILQFAKRRGLVEKNVADGVRRHADVKRTRFLDFGEIKTFGRALRQEEVKAPVACAAIRFLLLSGCRRMEALTLQESFVDRRGGCIRFPDTKTGAQLRPIGKAAFAVLKTIESRDGWAFPAERGEGHYVGVPNVLDRVCARAGLEGVTVHVLRHSFAAAAATMGYSQLTIAGLLGHSMPGVTARYAHVADRALVAAADAVSQRIATSLDARSGRSSPEKQSEKKPSLLFLCGDAGDGGQSRQYRYKS